MLAFFKGWRRKVGCVALIFALLVLLAWARSYAVVDVIRFVSGRNQFYIHAIEGRTLCHVSTAGIGSWNSWQTASLANESVRRSATNHFENIVRESSSEELVLIHFWALALPLTFLSAYLMLWKPRTMSAPNLPISTQVECRAI